MTYDVSARPCHSYQMQIPEQPTYGTEIFATLSVSDLENLFCQWLHWGRYVPRDGDKRELKDEVASPVQLVLEKI